MSNIPENLKYSKSHEWVLEEDGVFTIGLTDYAQNALGDIVFINLPEEGDSVTAGESFSDVESVKAVSDVFSPVTGTVTAVNEALLDDPAQVNEAPYEAWLIKVSEVSDTEELLDAEGYEAVVAALYLDGGVEAARDFIYRTLIPRMSEDMALEPENPKSALQERLQEDGITPTYKLVETQGPPHDRTFVAQVFAGNQGLARGTGRTKKEAESQAAKSTLARLGEFFGLGMDEQARAEKAAAAKQAKADKAAARAEEKARKKHERELHKSMKQG